MTGARRGVTGRLTAAADTVCRHALHRVRHQRQVSQRIVARERHRLARDGAGATGGDWRRVLEHREWLAYRLQTDYTRVEGLRSLEVDPLVVLRAVMGTVGPVDPR
jgi:hypothetical protein